MSPIFHPAISSSDHCKKTKTLDNIIDREDTFSPFPHFVWTVTYIYKLNNKTAHAMIHKALSSNCYHL